MMRFAISHGLRDDAQRGLAMRSSCKASPHDALTFNAATHLT
jgi:hypothetical protein